MAFVPQGRRPDDPLVRRERVRRRDRLDADPPGHGRRLLNRRRVGGGRVRAARRHGHSDRDPLHLVRDRERRWSVVPVLLSVRWETADDVRGSGRDLDERDARQAHGAPPGRRPGHAGLALRLHHGRHGLPLRRPHARRRHRRYVAPRPFL